MCGAPITDPSIGTTQEHLVGCPECLKLMPQETARRHLATEPAPPPAIDPDATLDPSKEINIPDDTPVPFSLAELQGAIAEELDDPHVRDLPPLTVHQEAARKFAMEHLPGTSWHAFAEFLSERDRTADVPLPADGPPICSARRHVWKSEADARGYHYEFCTVCKRTAYQIIEALEDRRTSPRTYGHVITIVVKPNGVVQGDLNDKTPLWPIGSESTAESTTIDGQAHNIVEQACGLILRGDLAAAAKRTAACKECGGTGRIATEPGSYDAGRVECPACRSE